MIVIGTRDFSYAGRCHVHQHAAIHSQRYARDEVCLVRRKKTPRWRRPSGALLASEGHARIMLMHDFVSRLVDGLMSSRISPWAASGSFGTCWLPGRPAGS